MLVLSRKRGEAIIAGTVEITVVSIQGNRVRLGIIAPADVPIRRESGLGPIASKIDDRHDHQTVAKVEASES